MKAKLASTAFWFYILALSFVLFGIVKQWRHIPNASNMYYVGVGDAIVALCMLAVSKVLKNDPIS